MIKKRKNVFPLNFTILDNIHYFTHDIENEGGHQYDIFNVVYEDSGSWLFPKQDKTLRLSYKRNDTEFYNRDMDDGKVEGWYVRHTMTSEAKSIYNILNNAMKEKENREKTKASNKVDQEKIKTIIQELRQEYASTDEYSLAANLILDKIEKKFFEKTL